MKRFLEVLRNPSTRLDDEEVLRSVYAKHSGELFGFARNLLHDSGLAEEAVQETFLRAWRAADRYDESTASVRSWLFAICRNVVIDLNRRRSVRPLQAYEDQSSNDTPMDVDDIDRWMTTFQLEEALRRLSSEHRHVLMETVYKGRPAAEVAAELGVPTGTVRSRQFYALKALRLALEEMGWSNE